MKDKFFNKITEIGEPYLRFDACEKVTGQTRYAADFYSEEMLWVGVKRAMVAHGILRSVDFEDALKIKGVKGVLTSRDVKGTNRYGVIQKDQEVLVEKHITYRGAPVALVIAESKEILNESLDAIKLDIEEIPGVFSTKEALKKDAPIIYKEHKNGNTLLEGELSKGDVEAGFAESDVVIEKEFSLPVQEHAYLETETGWAIFKNNVLEITVSTQTPFRDRNEVAEALGIPFENVRIIAPYCGGAFGGKDGITVQAVLGLAAINFPNTPLKIYLNREESFVASSKRHSAKVYYKIGAKLNGELQSLVADIKFDTGAHDHLGGVVMALGLEHAGGVYNIKNTKIKSAAIYTNNPVAGAFRGFGVPQVTAGIEQMIDMVAEKLDMSPLELRKKNTLKKGEKNAINVTMLSSMGIDECLEVIENSEFWINRDEWKKEAEKNKKRGVGLACAIQGIGYGPIIPDVANAKIELTKEGTFKIYCGVVDMGQGNVSEYLQIAGYILKQPFSNLEAVLPDTKETLPSGSSSASRTTFTFGKALIDASKKLRKRIIERCADLVMDADLENFDIVNDKVIYLPTGREMPLKELAKYLNEHERVAVARYRAPVHREMPTNDKDLRIHGIPHKIFSFGMHLVGVEVDLITGNVALKKYIIANESGNIINPQIFEQQVHGGIAQGIGYAMYEDMKVEKGKILTEDFSTYILPTSLDIPDMEPLVVRRYEESGPYGLKGVGEIAIDAPLPAISNAVYDACGVRVSQFPITGEKIIKDLRLRD